jgi:hypothetical protein
MTMIYDKENARKLISHLITQSTILNRITRLFWALFFGSLATLLVGLLSRDSWWLGGIIGILLGYGIGTYLASVQNLVIEWMAQTLIAQGEMLDWMKKFPEITQ